MTKQCSEDGTQFCESMELNNDYDDRNTKGLKLFSIVNLRTGKGYKVLGYRRNSSKNEGGTILNFCPFCGTQYKFEGLKAND